MTDTWSERAELYRQSPIHREGEDLELLVKWAGPGEGRTALDVATGGGHLARRLREAGFAVVTADRAPGMQPDVVCSAEALPFGDARFDLVATRIAPHHFHDVQAAVSEMARVACDLVLIEDGLYMSGEVEEVDRLRDPSHVRCYTEEEWRAFVAGAGLTVEEVRVLDRLLDVETWIGLAALDAETERRVRERLAGLVEVEDGRLRTEYILLRARRP
jgi:SAM-dependent methyltransferase